jgi:O-antigen/teichoic acid export membrane protein
MLAWLKRKKAQVRARLGILWWYSAVLFVVQNIGALISVYIGLWLVPKWVSPSDLGAVLPLGQIGAILSLPLAVLMTPFSKFINVFSAGGEWGKTKALLIDVLALVAAAALLTAGLTFAIMPLVFERMRVHGSVLAVTLCGLGLTNVLMPLLGSALQAMQRFRILTVASALTPVVRLGLLWLLLPVAGLTGFFGTQLLTDVLYLGGAVWALRAVLGARVKRASYRSHLREIGLFTLPVITLTVVGRLHNTVELFVIRHRLPDIDSAAYYMFSRFAEIPSSIWGAMIIVFFPLVSDRHEKGADTDRILRQTLAFVLLAGLALGALLTCGAHWLLLLVPAGRAYLDHTWLMGLLVLRCVLTMAVICFTTHETACRRFRFAWYVVALQLLEVALLYALTGIGFFRPYLPETWWRALAGINACHLPFVIYLMLSYTVAAMLCVAGHLALRRRMQQVQPLPVEQA